MVYSLTDAFQDLNKADIDVKSIRGRKHRKLNEAVGFDINSPSDMHQAKEYQEEVSNEDAQTELEVVDTNLDSNDHATDNKQYVGQRIISCNSCKTNRFVDVDALKKNDDGSFSFIDEKDNECPHCHDVNPTYSIVGDVAAVQPEQPAVEDDDMAFTNDEAPAEPEQFNNNEEPEEEPSEENSSEDTAEPVEDENDTGDDLVKDFDTDTGDEELSDDEVKEIEDSDSEKEIYPWDEDKKDKENESLNEDTSINITDEVWDEMVPSEIELDYSYDNDDFDVEKEFEFTKYTNTTGAMSDYGDTGEANSTETGHIRNWAYIVEPTRQNVAEFMKTKYDQDSVDDRDVQAIFVEGESNGLYEEFVDFLKDIYKVEAEDDCKEKADTDDVTDWESEDDYYTESTHDELDDVDLEELKSDDEDDIDYEEEKPAYTQDDLYESICKANNLDPKNCFDARKNQYWIKEALNGNSDNVEQIYNAFVKPTMNEELIKGYKERTGYKTELESLMEKEGIKMPVNEDTHAKEARHDDVFAAKEEADKLVNEKDLAGVIYGYNRGDKFYAIPVKECKTLDDLLEARKEVMKQYRGSSVSVAYPDKSAYESFTDRKSLGQAIVECKEKGIKYTVRKSINEGYRYDLIKHLDESLTINTTSAAHIEVNNQSVTVDADDKHIDMQISDAASVTHNEDGSVVVSEGNVNVEPAATVEPIEEPTPVDMGAPEDVAPVENTADEVVANEITPPEANADVVPDAEVPDDTQVDIETPVEPVEGEETPIDEPIDNEDTVDETDESLNEDNEEPIDVDVEKETTEGTEEPSTEVTTKSTDSTEVGDNMSDEDREIVKKLLRITADTYTAIKNNYGIEVDPRLVLQDMIQDLKLIGGAVKPESLPDTPLSELTKSMYEMFSGFMSMFGIDHEDQLNTALQMLDGPAFTTEGINKSIASDKFLTAVRSGAISYIPDNIERLPLSTQAQQENESLKESYDKLSDSDLAVEDAEFAESVEEENKNFPFEDTNPEIKEDIMLNEKDFDVPDTVDESLNEDEEYSDGATDEELNTPLVFEPNAHLKEIISDNKEIGEEMTEDEVNELADVVPDGKLNEDTDEENKPMSILDLIDISETKEDK